MYFISQVISYNKVVITVITIEQWWLLNIHSGVEDLWELPPSLTEIVCRD